jgi:hypothetical protein
LSRRRKTVVLVPCPTCGQPMGPQVQAMVQQLGGKRRRLPTNHRRTRSNGHRFETTAQAIALPAKPKWQRPQSPTQIADPLDQSPLSPGEHRVSMVWRQWSLSDVVTSLALAAVSGALVGLLAVVICVALKTEWYWPVGFWLGSTTIVWGIKVIDFFIDRKTVASEQTMDRDQEPTPTIVQSPAVKIRIVDPQTKQIGYAELHSPVSNSQGLAEYADALIRGTAMPSMDGGKETNGARAYGYTEPEFEQWRKEAVRAHLLESRGKGQGYKITPRGRRSFERIAELELKEMKYGYGI